MKKRDITDSTSNNNNCNDSVSYCDNAVFNKQWNNRKGK